MNVTSSLISSFLSFSSSSSSDSSSEFASSYSGEVKPTKPDAKAWEKNGGFILYFLLMCYIFVGFEVLCDAFFVPGLNLLCEKFHITKDFAGATLMGIGGNLPDIFSGIIGVCVLNTDVGPGSIVGSMLFNHLCIVGCTVLFVGNIKISVKSITREVTFYILTIIAFLLVLLDQKIEVWESVILILIYVIYVVVCGCTPYISRWVEAFGKGKRNKRIRSTGADEYTSINDDEVPDYGIEDDTVNSQRYKSIKEMYNAGVYDDEDEQFEKEIYENCEHYDSANNTTTSENDYNNSNNSNNNDSEGIRTIPPKDLPQISSSPVYIIPKDKRRGYGTSPKPNSPTPGSASSKLSKGVTIADEDDVIDENDTNNTNNDNDGGYDGNESETDGEGYNYDPNDDSLQRKKENKEMLVTTHSQVFSRIVEANEGLGEEVESGARIGLEYGKVQMHGFLYKKSRWYNTMSISSRVWQKRWFVLDERLWYCRNPLYINKRKELPLWKAWKISQNKEDPCSIEIYTKRQTYILRAEEEENARRWVRELKSRVKTVKRMHPELYTANGLVDVEDDDDDESLLEFPYYGSVGSIIMWVISLPFAALFTITIPDIKRERLQKFLPLTFLMVVVWLGCMSYAMIWGAKNFARVVGIPDDIMGMSITAIGASLPSLFSSVIAARQGEGNMAISNAFGSNLTALLALGLPCFVYSSMMHPGMPYKSDSSAIFITVAALFIAVIIFVIVVLLGRLTLKRAHGAFFLGLYAVLLAGIILCQVFGVNFSFKKK